MIPTETAVALVAVVIGVPVLFWYQYQLYRELRAMDDEEKAEISELWESDPYDDPFRWP